MGCWKIGQKLIIHLLKIWKRNLHTIQPAEDPAIPLGIQCEPNLHILHCCANCKVRQGQRIANEEFINLKVSFQMIQSIVSVFNSTLGYYWGIIIIDSNRSSLKWWKEYGRIVVKTLINASSGYQICGIQWALLRTVLRNQISGNDCSLPDMLAIIGKSWDGMRWIYLKLYQINRFSNLCEMYLLCNIHL